MKAKKMFSAMMAGAMALSLVACGGSSASSSTAASSATQDTAATSTADSAPVNIVWAGWSGEEEASKDIFQRMMKTYEDQTGNTVSWVGWTWADTAQQLLIRTQGNEQLDLAQTDIGIFNTVAQADVLADWNDILGKDYLEANFEQSALDVGNIDGKQLGLHPYTHQRKHRPQRADKKRNHPKHFLLLRGNKFLGLSPEATVHSKFLPSCSSYFQQRTLRPSGITVRGGCLSWQSLAA